MSEKTAKRYLSPNEAAEYLGVSTRALRRDVVAGRLVGYKYGSKSVRFAVEDLDNLLKPINTAGA